MCMQFYLLVSRQTLVFCVLEHIVCPCMRGTLNTILHNKRFSNARNQSRVTTRLQNRTPNTAEGWRHLWLGSRIAASHWSNAAFTGRTIPGLMFSPAALFTNRMCPYLRKQTRCGHERRKEGNSWVLSWRSSEKEILIHQAGVLFKATTFVCTSRGTVQNWDKRQQQVKAAFSPAVFPEQRIWHSTIWMSLKADQLIL